MWLIVKTAVVLLLSIWIVRQCYRLESACLRFCVMALWLRFSLAAFSEFTYPVVAAGLSIIAIVTLAVACWGLLVLPSRYFLLRFNQIFYAFFVVVVVSAFVNLAFKGLAQAAIKWIFFMVFSLSLYVGIKEEGRNQALISILSAFSIPLVLQLLSLVLGVAKQTEADGSVSYIGGYFHESGFSMILVGYMYVLALIEPGHLRCRGWLILWGLIGLILANYRTSIIAVMPMLIQIPFIAVVSRLEKSNKLVGVVGIIGLIILLLPLVGGQIAERFSDISVALAKAPELISAPRYYTEQEQDLFSARAYIWSSYITAYSQFDLLGTLFGKGPESWSGVFLKYAHNIFVSYLYEFGLFGLLAIIGLFTVLIVAGFWFGGALLGGAFVGFVLLSSSTMPLWSIEGLLALAVVYAFLLYQCYGQFRRS